VKIIVLLSAGLHPVSGRPCPVPVELQAIGLANHLVEKAAAPGDVTHSGQVIGLHAGDVSASIEDCLGHGLSEILVLQQAGSPIAALTAAIRDLSPDLVLAGRRGRGAEDSGQLPYHLAASLGWPICADAIAIAPRGDVLDVTQALPRGARRRVTVRLPSLLTVHGSAPAASAFALAAARRGKIQVSAAGAMPCRDRTAAAEHAYRRRPRLVRGVKLGGKAEDRLKAATEIAGGGRLMIDPSPEEAAEAIYTLLLQLGVIA
jgi:electron transfer flavoprotein beta subunit